MHAPMKLALVPCTTGDPCTSFACFSYLGCLAEVHAT